MEIRVIDENHGNPFKYYENDSGFLTHEKHRKQHSSMFYNYPRSYKDYETVKTVMYDLMVKMEVGSGIDCLEVGSGGKPNPSRALYEMGAAVTTLDADWTDEHMEMSYEAYMGLKRRLGKDLLIPRFMTNGGVDVYMGDLAFLRDDRSSLKDKEFDLIYFWGSLHHTGFCSSIQNSNGAEEHGIDIDYIDRLSNVFSALKEGGKILSISQYFCGHRDENIKKVINQNLNQVDSALFFAFGGPKKAKSIEFFTQSPESTLGKADIEMNEDRRAFRREMGSELDDEAFSKNPIDRTIENGYNSLFGEEDDYAGLKSARKALGSEDNKLENLGMVDAVFVEF